MKGQTGSFSVLESTESSNNYAMGQLRAGLAKAGDAWFAREQTAGRGQRAKTWESAAGENILLSVAVRPAAGFIAQPFLLSMAAAIICRDFFSELADDEILIKWPNDIYRRDRKTAGILIDNIFSGDTWNYAVIGVGMNINQTAFANSTANATSLKLITGRTYDAELLARDLHQRLASGLGEAEEGLIENFNIHLYKRGQTVKLKSGSAVFETVIKHVNAYGQLLTEDAFERRFDVGEAEWKLALS